MGKSLYLFRLFGIPVRIHITWLVIFALITWSLAAGYFPGRYEHWSAPTYWIVGIITSLLFFASVLLHELAHSLVARAKGMKVRDIVLFIFGGVSEISEEPPSAGTEFLMALVGPLTSFVVGLLSLAIWLATVDVSEAVAAVARYLFWINMVLGIFNLIPGFPLDGGRVLRSILWGITGSLLKATRWATQMGIVISYALIALGIWQLLSGRPGGLWIALIGWFLNNAAQSSYSNVVVRDMLARHSVRDIVMRDCPRIPANLSLEALVHDYILAQGRRCLPVTEGDQLVGIVTVHRVKEAPRERWQQITARDVMIPLEQVKTIHPDKDLWTAFEQMTEQGVNQLLVVEQGQLVGMLGRDAVMGFLRIRAELGG